MQAVRPGPCRLVAARANLRRIRIRGAQTGAPDTSLPASRRLPEYSLLLSGLALTRIIGWGSIYYSPAVLAGYLEREIGLSPTVVFGGITILLVIGALISPMLGRHLDRRGTRHAMALGAVISGAGLALLALAQGPVSYLATWLVIGIGHAMQLANTGNVTVAQLMGERTRRVIGLMMLVTGLASSVFWPLTAWLSADYGWRACLLVFAAIQLVIVLPIHLAIPAYRAKPLADPGPSALPAEEQGRVPPGERQPIFWLLALSFSASGLVSWGLPLHMIGLMQSAGISGAAAVTIASLSGPATLMARAIDAVAGDRLPVEKVALAGLAVGPAACLLMALAPGSTAFAIAFVMLFSAAMGVIAVARATLPLALFGRNGFGAMLGRLTVPQNLTFAAAPLLFAFLVERMGASGTLVLSAAIQSFALLAMIMLVRRLRS
jgi:MFS family permease